MKTRNAAESAFTRLDAIVLIAAAVLLPAWAGIILPGMARPKVHACRINCVSNLKQVGLAYRMWANDNNDLFPFQVSTNQGGSLEFTNGIDFFRQFLVLSNELVSPKVLACPKDFTRTRATSFSQFGNSNLSYFVGLDANESRPQTILSGDRNVIGGGTGTMRRWTGTNAVDVRWTTGIHECQGNIALGDGSAQQVTRAALQRQIRAALESTQQVRFLVPP